MPTKTTQQSDTLTNPYGYSEMDWAAQLDPAYAAARAEVRRLSVGEDGTLSVKVKELIMLGILASRGLQYGRGWGRVLGKHSLPLQAAAFVAFDCIRAVRNLFAGDLQMARAMWAHATGILRGYPSPRI